MCYGRGVNDTITISGLKIETHIGVPDEERANPQTVSLDLEIEVATPFCELKDEIESTVDYFAV
ncbi:MAG: dihydroneopterin aldolase, partial [Verrucomicrobiales bacterium]|nr:dihydroneopterin aldolase [Verrucomicrobiales bacterium]